ncbi:hypothetical protein [Microbacterium aquimaris]|uniref:Secreted protein n=1 Tax=Microbacterium aquimaris TaxID=459816 RepID=A0ABU5N9G9_9MICO|nr:hypothetical protein [Microbacterium aquimaris]MDZ8162730.1 hypothetical protein [Microbacterium aquimaris]
MNRTLAIATIAATLLAVTACSSPADGDGDGGEDTSAAATIAERVLNEGEGLCASDMGGESYPVVEVVSVEENGDEANVEVLAETEDGREFSGELTIDLVEECATYISLVGSL